MPMTRPTSRMTALAAMVPKVMIWAHVVAAVLPGHIVDDLLTALVAEVDVKIGHTDPLRVQKTLEQQIVLQGVHAW